MSALAGYAKRLAALPRALGILELHPDGLRLTDLAAELAVEPDDLREVVLAYYRADLVELGNFGQPVVEFFALSTEGGDSQDGDTDDEVDPTTAQWVCVVSPDPEQELGVDHLGAEQLGRLFAAGSDRPALEPDNEVLRSALDAFQRALWPTEGPDGADWRVSTAQVLTARRRNGGGSACPTPGSGARAPASGWSSPSASCARAVAGRSMWDRPTTWQQCGPISCQASRRASCSTRPSSRRPTSTRNWSRSGRQ